MWLAWRVARMEKMGNCEKDTGWKTSNWGLDVDGRILLKWRSVKMLIGSVTYGWLMWKRWRTWNSQKRGISWPREQLSIFSMKLLFFRVNYKLLSYLSSCLSRYTNIYLHYPLEESAKWKPMHGLENSELILTPTCVDTRNSHLLNISMTFSYRHEAKLLLQNFLTSLIHFPLECLAHSAVPFRQFVLHTSEAV